MHKYNKCLKTCKYIQNKIIFIISESTHHETYRSKNTVGQPIKNKKNHKHPYPIYLFIRPLNHGKY